MVRFYFCYLLIFLCFVFSACNPGINSTPSHPNATINGLEIFRTLDANLTIEEIKSEVFNKQFKPSPNKIIRLGYTSDTLWLRFRIVTDTIPDTRLYLQVAYPLDEIELYIPNGNNSNSYKIVTGGENIPYMERTYKYRRQLFAIPFSNQIYYLKIKSDTALTVPLDVITDEILVNEIQSKQIQLGVYCGIIVLIGAFVWLVFFKIRKIYFFYYTLYFQSCLFFHLYLSRLPRQWLEPYLPYNKSINAILTNLIITFAGLYIYSFLKKNGALKKYFTYPLYLLITLSLANVMLSAVLPYNLYAPVTWYFALIAALVIIGLFSKYFLSLKEAEQFYFLGMISFLIGNSLELLRALDLIPVNTPYIDIAMGTSIQSAFFILGVSRHIKILYAEKSKQETLALIEKEKNLRLETISNLSRQVAHDIRSPLAALSVVAMNVPELSEDKRIMIRSAVQRIDDIANDLVQSHKPSENKINSEDQQDNESSVQLLSSIIDSLISEKRLQYRSKLGVVIQSDLDVSSYGLFAKIQTTTFKRVISNLINNAVEAMKDKGTVTVSLVADRRSLVAGEESSNEKILITISDTGPGIPPDILPKLMQKGASFGKKTGSGLGLFHARKTVESWGGTIVIESVCATEMGRHGGLPLPKQNTGTTITLILPRADAPSWFVPELKLTEKTQIVILDDDSSIHQIWTNRFDNLKIKRERVLHFTTPDTLIEWHRQNKNQNPDTLFLCDYELLGSEKTGLETIKELGISKQAILVTSRFEEDHIRSECAQMGIKFIPKNLAGFVPISVFDEKDCHAGLDPASSLAKVIQETGHRVKHGVTKSNTPAASPDAIFIDDSEMNRNTWAMVAKMCKTNLVTFSDPKEFYAVMDSFDRTTVIYIDSELADGVKGEIVAKDLREKGFEKIYLATGHPASEFADMPWLTGVVGKNPPFKKSV